jgi:hypothetical protein
MAERKNEEEYFEVFYHPDEFTSLFKYAFESFEQIESVVKKEYPGFVQVPRTEAKHPFVSITLRKSKEEEITTIFFSKIKEQNSK